MLRTILHRLRLALLGAAGAALVVVTTTALAGSGVGGIFNLGQVNTVDAQTSLTGNPGGSPELKVTSTGTAAAVRGVASTGIGTNGVSTSGVGQQGLSNSGIGTLGTHGNTTGISPGVQGETNSTDPGGAGVLGKNNGGGPGLRAVVNAGAPPLAVNSPVKVANLNADLLDGLDSTGLPYWKLGGNAGTTPGTNFLGTTDNQALELKVNGARALRLEPDATSPNLIGGFYGNSVDATHLGSVVAGGGASGSANHVENDYDFIGAGFGNDVGTASAGGASAVVAGTGNVASGGSAFIGAGADNQATANYASVVAGRGNTASGQYSAVAGGFGNTASGYASSVGGGLDNTAGGGYYSTVAGGIGNTAGGNYSFAAGKGANASDDGSFVWGDGNSSFFVGSNGANTFTARTTGGARFISAIDPGTGAPTAGVSLAAGGGSWSSLSDRASKRGFTPVDPTRLLSRLDRIPIMRWGYKAQAPSIRHLGPTAQDFRAAFGLGEDERHIDTIDSEGVALAAIQGLYRQNQALQRENGTLRAQLGAQNARLTKLEHAVSTLHPPRVRPGHQAPRPAQWAAPAGLRSGT
jgi:hypothetical protein